MKLKDLFNLRRPIKGLIGHHGLGRWWGNELTELDRTRILEVFHPTTAAADSLLEGDIYSSESPVAFLTNLAGWLRKDSDRTIGYKVLAKAEQLVGCSADVLDKHFFFQQKLEMHYRDRAIPSELAEAERACLCQVGISSAAAIAFQKESSGPLPEHAGYARLLRILKERGAMEEVLSLSERAKSEGWSGPWAEPVTSGPRHK